MCLAGGRGRGEEDLVGVADHGDGLGAVAPALDGATAAGRSQGTILESQHLRDHWLVDVGVHVAQRIGVADGTIEGRGADTVWRLVLVPPPTSAGDVAEI